MIRRIFNTPSLISALLLACTILLCVSCFWADARSDH
jgi:hypothetical protein